MTKKLWNFATYRAIHFIIMQNFKIIFIVATCILNLVPLDASVFEIYYFDHPRCGFAEYKGEVLESKSEGNVWETFGVKLQTVDKFMVDFVNDVKTNVASKFGANIICGGKLIPSLVNYRSNGNDYVDLTLTFTGTAMKTDEALWSNSLTIQKLDSEKIEYKYVKIVYTKGMRSFY